MWLAIASVQASTLPIDSAHTDTFRPALDITQLNTREVPLSSIMQYRFIDDPAMDSLTAIRAMAADQFKQHHKRGPNFGYQSRPIWFRWEIDNPSTEDYQWLLDMRVALISNVTLYQPDMNGGYSAVKTGTEIPYRNRPVDADQLAFNVTSPAQSKQVFYMRMETQYSMRLPGVLITEQQWHKERLFHERFYSLLFGVLLAQGLYNLMLFFSLRDPMYLTYVAFVSAATLNQILFWGFLSSWMPDSFLPWINAIVHACIMVVAFFAMLFVYQFLNLARQQTWQRLLARGVLLFLGVQIVIPLLFPVLHVAPLMNMSVSISLVLCTLLCLLQSLHNASARFLLIGWIGLITGGIFEMLRNTGVLPFTTLTKMVFPIGLMLDALMLSFALADRIRRIRREHTAAQLQLTEALSLANDELEQRVADRTRQLTDAHNAAQEAIKIKNNFLQLISHDLRSPLTSLKMLLGLLEDDPKKNLPLLEHSGPLLDQIVERIDRLSHVRQIDTSQHWQQQRQDTELYSLVQARVQQLENKAAKRGVKLLNAVTPGPTVHADSFALSDVLDNLLNNALRFSKQGQHIQICGPGEDYTLAVIDQGPGLDHDVQTRLFQMPVTSKPGIQGERGQGYGLLLCRQIMDAHGGRLWYTPAPEGGSCFKFYLPAPEVCLTKDEEVDIPAIGVQGSEKKNA